MLGVLECRQAMNFAIRQSYGFRCDFLPATRSIPGDVEMLAGEKVDPIQPTFAGGDQKHFSLRQLGSVSGPLPGPAPVGSQQQETLPGVPGLSSKPDVHPAMER